MINGKIFAKFQKLLPKMNKGLKAKHCTPNAFFMADSEGCMAMDGFSLLYAPVEDACEQPVALTEMPKAKFGDAVFIEAGKFDATIKDGGTSVTVPKDERGNEALLANFHRECISVACNAPLRDSLFQSARCRRMLRVSFLTRLHSRL